MTARNAQQAWLDPHLSPLEAEVPAVPAPSPRLMGPLEGIKQASLNALSNIDPSAFRANDPSVLDPLSSHRQEPSSLAKSLSPIPPIAESVYPVAKSAGLAAQQVPSNVFALNAEGKKQEISNPAMLVLNTGLEFEKRKTARFAELRTEIQQAKIRADLFLKVQSECQKLSPDLKIHPVSQELKKAIEQLRDKQVDLLSKDVTEITLDQLVALKSDIASRLETLRTMEMQIPFMESEKISSELKSIYDTLQKVLQLVDRLIARINSRTGR